jgi:hypothetical protein
MKKMINKTMRNLMFAASLSLAIASCSKNETQHLQADATLSNEVSGNVAVAPSYCAPIPSDLQPPAGNKFALQTYATGVQIYQVQRSAADPNVFVWVNTAPSANLYAKADYTIQVGIHYAGPTWQFTKGPFKNEKVVATKIKPVLVDPTAVPWLLLKAVDSLSSPGNKITYIQRICTTGGLAPTNPATNLGDTVNIPYTATYLFYIKE